MADELLARVNEMRAAIATKDLDALVAISDPEIELRSFFAMAAGGGYHGHEDCASTCAISTRPGSR